MSKSEEIKALKNEIKKKERQIYEANKGTNAWSKSMVRSQSNSKATRLFIETQRGEVATLKGQLLKLNAGK